MTPIDITKTVGAIASAPQRLAIWIAVFLLLVLGVTGANLAIYHQGVKAGQLAERDTWENLEASRRLADQALTEEHEREMEALRQSFINHNLKVTTDHEKELVKVRTDAAADRADADRRGGLRIPAAACPASGAIAGTEATSASQRDDAGTATVRLPIAVENGLWDLANDADAVSAQLRACQSWIKGNGFYGPVATENTSLLDRMIATTNDPAEEPTP